MFIFTLSVALVNVNVHTYGQGHSEHPPLNY